MCMMPKKEKKKKKEREKRKAGRNTAIDTMELTLGSPVLNSAFPLSQSQFPSSIFLSWLCRSVLKAKK